MDWGQKLKFSDKTPQGRHSIQFSNRFAVLGELYEEKIHDYCVSNQVDSQGSKVGCKFEEKQLRCSHDHVTGESEFSNIQCESVFCKNTGVA